MTQVIRVCKTRVPYGGEPTTMFMLFSSYGAEVSFQNVDDLATYLREDNRDTLVKNDPPADFLLCPARPSPFRVTELERLSKGELDDLVKLLRR